MLRSASVFLAIFLLILLHAAFPRYELHQGNGPIISRFDRWTGRAEWATVGNPAPWLAEAAPRSTGPVASTIVDEVERARAEFGSYAAVLQHLGDSDFQRRLRERQIDAETFAAAVRSSKLFEDVFGPQPSREKQPR